MHRTERPASRTGTAEPQSASPPNRGRRRMRTTAMLARACDGESCMSESSTPTSNAGTTTPRERRHRKTKRLERATTDERPGDRPRGLPRDPGAGAVGLFLAQGRRRPPRSGGAAVRLGDRADGRMADLHHRRLDAEHRPGGVSRSGSTASSPLPRASRSPIFKAMPRAEQVSDFHCVTGWSVSDVRWAGVRLPDLLAECRR